MGLGLFGVASVLGLKRSGEIQLGKMKDYEIGLSEAHGKCGTALNCSGGGGQCGTALNCGGGGGKCGTALNCGGGGGKCGTALNCAGE